MSGARDKMAYYYEFSGIKNGIPLSLCVNSFNSTLFHRQSRLELAYVLQGSFNLYTENINANITKHDIAVVAPNDIHMLESVGAERGILLILHLDVEWLPEQFFETGRFEHDSVVYTAADDSEGYNKLKAELSKLVSTLIEEKTVRGSDITLIAASMLDAIMSDGSEQREYYIDKKSDLAKSLEIVKYIESKLEEEITLEDIAEQLHYSESYASKFFKKNMGISFSKFLARTRIRASLEDLVQGDLTISEIASKYGLANTKAYAAYFKEFYEITPNMYRKRFESKREQSDYDTAHGYQMMRDEVLALLAHMINREMKIDVGTDAVLAAKGECTFAVDTLYVNDIDYCLNSSNYLLFDDIVNMLNVKGIIIDNVDRLLEILSDNALYYAFAEFVTHVSEMGLETILVDGDKRLEGKFSESLAFLQAMQVKINTRYVTEYKHEDKNEANIESILGYSLRGERIPCSMFSEEGYYHMIDEHNYKSDFFFIVSMIAKMEGKILLSNTGCAVTLCKKSLQILLYNDNNMDDCNEVTYKVNLKVPTGRYFATEYYVNEILGRHRDEVVQNPMVSISNRRRLYARHSGKFGHATETIYANGGVNVVRTVEKGKIAVLVLNEG